MAANSARKLVVRPSNVRIWCHDCDMEQLQKIVWEGQGSKLLLEMSNQPHVKKFLEAVPYIMNTIKQTHTAVIDGDTEELKRVTDDPVASIIFTSKDKNGLTALHKAAGLGHDDMVEYIVEKHRDVINQFDNDGRTPLFYAATIAGNDKTFQTLVNLGAKQELLDDKEKTAAYYINRPTEIDRTLLTVVPDAPRKGNGPYPPMWEWKILKIEKGDVKLEKIRKTRRRHKSSTEKLSNTEQHSITSPSNTVEPKLNKQDMMKSLPDLRKTDKQDNKIARIAKTKIRESEILTKTCMKRKNGKVQPADNDIDEKPPEMKENEDPNLKAQGEPKKKLEEAQDMPEKESNGQIINGSDVIETRTKLDSKYETLETENGIKLESSDEKSLENTETCDSKLFDSETKFVRSEELPNLSEVITNESSSYSEITLNNNNDRDLVQIISNPKNILTTKAEESLQVQNNSNPSTSESKNNNTPPSSSGRTKSQKNKIDSLKSSPKSTLSESSYHQTPDLQKKSIESGKSRVSTSKSFTPENYRQDQVAVEILSSESNDDDDDVTVQGDDAERKTSSKRDSSGRGIRQGLFDGLVNNDISLDQEILESNDQPNQEGDIFVIRRDDNMTDDGEVLEMIRTGNMEMLAGLVLNGEGHRLLGKTSENKEIQAFIENVPTYMKKINRVHLAAKEGNIRDLQAALDRRKFAIARDQISPNGATPLHVATVYGKTNIIKYLGGRFPETLSAVDFEGRTALHYAAALPDNGHYYNLLQHIGANAKDIDDNGKSAEEYYKTGRYLNYKELLATFGIDETVGNDMFTDRVPNDQVSSRRELDDTDVLQTLDRCYSLLHSVLPSAKDQTSNGTNRSSPPVLLGKFLHRHVYEIIKTRITKLDHDLFDVIWPAVKKLPNNKSLIQIVEEDFSTGVTAPDYYVYDVFEELLIPFVKHVHNAHVVLVQHPETDFKTLGATSIELDLDPSGELILSGTIECARNLQCFELPLNLNIGQLEEVERIITAVVMSDDFMKVDDQTKPESDQKKGSYYTLSEILESSSDIKADLATSGLLIPLCEANEIDDSDQLHGRFWPYGRGVYISDDKSVAVWINVQDHLRVLIATPQESPGEIGETFTLMIRLMNYLHESLEFIWDSVLGHLTSRPSFLGCALRFNVITSFPNLSKDLENMKKLCTVRSLELRETIQPEIFRISNYQCLGVTESQCFKDFAAAAGNLIKMESDIISRNATQISTMLSNIFKRKRSSLSSEATD